MSLMLIEVRAVIVTTYRLELFADPQGENGDARSGCARAGSQWSGKPKVTPQRLVILRVLKRSTSMHDQATQGQAPSCPVSLIVSPWRLGFRRILKRSSHARSYCPRTSTQLAGQPNRETVVLGGSVDSQAQRPYTTMRPKSRGGPFKCTCMGSR